MDGQHDHFAMIATSTQNLAADTCEELPSFVENSAAIEGQWGKISTIIFASKVNEYYDIATEHLRAKMALLHPIGQDVNREELLQGIPPEVHSVMFENLGAKRIYSAALWTHGSSGPSGLDANNLKKVFCSRKHNRASESLCESLAALGRRICTEFVDSKSLESYIACRAIALSKNDGKILDSLNNWLSSRVVR